MLDRLLRSLGLTRAASPAASPAAAPDALPAADRIAAMRARLPADRSRAGTLEAYDSNGAVVSGPWPVTARADPALAAARGNLSRDRMRMFGDTPEGEFHIVARRPGSPGLGAPGLGAPGLGAPGLGAPGLGVHDVFVLQPVSGPAAMADGNGRTALLLHGGEPHLAPTDGSLRVPDDAMAEMLAMTTPEPGARSPRIVLTVRDQLGWDDWRQARAEAGSPARQRWFRAQGYAADADDAIDDDWQGGSAGWADVYDPYYGGADDGAADPGWQADQAAAAALADAGFGATPPNALAPDAPASDMPFDPAFDAAGADFSGGGAYDR